MDSRGARDRERGVSAVLIALSMMLVLGFAAVAIDLGFGFNERRQDQTAADLGVMAGAVNYVDPSSSPTNENIITDILGYVRTNLDTSYTDPEWQAMWQTCTDPDRVDFEIGGGTQVTFQPMSQPSAWGPGVLDCVSTASSYLRVRVPNQSIDTSFAKILGFDTLTTHGAAVAILDSGDDFHGLIPFGIPGGTGAGEICLKSSGSGTASLPCQGANAGAFGEINSEFFGDFFGSPDCGLPGATELAQNTAIGLDHFVAQWPSAYAAAEGVSLGSPHSGDGAVAGYHQIAFDQCSISGGVVVEENPGQTFPPNTVRVGTGFSPAAVEEGLISNSTFLGENSRLQQGGNPTRPIIKRRQGSNEVVYNLDNVGLWDYLTDPPGPSSNTCDGSTYSGLTTDQKVARIHHCLTTYTVTKGVVFEDSIADSPRFGWAPEYWHAVSTSGTSFQPVYRYRMIFVGGIYFNCSSTTCGAVFYPDQEETSEVCEVSGSHCQVLTLSQLSAWLIPTEAINPDVAAAFPGGQTPFQAALFK
jgi:Putative Flp pilus-assembly TadE/G-like